jgi:hypothetical protein
VAPQALIKMKVEVALSIAAALHTFDATMVPLTQEAGELDRSTAVQKAWRDWHVESNKLLVSASQETTLAPMCEKLNRELAFARLIQKMSAQDIQRRYQAFLNGTSKVLSREEAKHAVQMADRR